MLYMEPVENQEMALIQERVAKGAELLDKKKPGWWKPETISLEELAEENITRNVLAHVVGYRYDALGYFSNARAIGLSDSEEPEHGFHAESRHPNSGGDIEILRAEYDQLTAEWKRIILERREAANAEV